MTETRIKGLKISPGIAFGVPIFLRPMTSEAKEVLLAKNEVAVEIERYKYALRQSRQDLRYLQERSSLEGKNAVAQILEAHLEILQDPLITEMIIERISKLKKNTETIFQQFLKEYRKNFQNKDLFFQERMGDIQDVAGRILSHLHPRFQDSSQPIFQEAIVFSKELIPSLAVELAQKKCAAFVTEKGCETSHTAIIARSKKIPFVSGLDLNNLQLPEGKIIVDGDMGEIIFNPTEKTLKSYLKKKNRQEKAFLKEAARSDLPVKTKDGIQVALFANVEDEYDFWENGASGIGLFRTEYLCLKAKAFPSEKEQFETYKALLLHNPQKPTVIRLFDIGSDKNVASSTNTGFRPKEENPALGFRAIRFLLKNQTLLEEQARALLQASLYGDLHILVPFVSDLSEFLQVKSIIQNLEKQLHNKEKENLVKIGAMIEIPSAALMSDQLAEASDFISIGTNDLTQYLMAADRSNEEVRHLYNFASPALICLIDKIVKSSQKVQKPLFLCGEMAADCRYTKLLIGLGVKNFSISPSFFEPLRQEIKKTSFEEAKIFAEKALQSRSLEEMLLLFSDGSAQLDSSKMQKGV